MEERALQLDLVRTCLLIACLVSCHSLAPSCLRVTVEENFDRSDIVFTGSVLSKSEAPEKYSQRSLYGNEEDERSGALEVLFKVETNWKGKLDEPVLLYTVNPEEDSSLGYHFEVEGKYVVFARYWDLEEDGDGEETETNLWTELCSQNINLESVENKNSLIRKLALLKSKSEISEKTSEEGEISEQDTKTPESADLTDPSKSQQARN